MSGGQVVGPNAAIQLAEALKSSLGEEAAAQVFKPLGLGGWLLHPPQRMIPETIAAQLFDQLYRQFPGRAADIARQAGKQTGLYILANRIPHLAKAILKLMPRMLSGPLLLRAIGRHAWTFAGSGHVLIKTKPLSLTIRNNPINMPGHVWHCAVITALFQELINPDLQCRERLGTFEIA